MVGGLGAEFLEGPAGAPDLRHARPAIPLRHRLSHRSNTARLALQNGEINVHSESTPGYFGVVEPSLVKTGKVMPLWYDPTYDGKAFTPLPAMAGKGIDRRFPEFYKAVKGGAPSGELWEAYRDQSRRSTPPMLRARGHAAGFAAGRGRGAAHRR